MKSKLNISPYLFIISISSDFLNLNLYKQEENNQDDSIAFTDDWYRSYKQSHWRNDQVCNTYKATQLEQVQAQEDLERAHVEVIVQRKCYIR